MAKKENKYIGYIVLSFIPLIGIVWAGVAGIRHNYYVDNAQEAEIEFESFVKEKINSLDEVYPQIGDDFNITSASLQTYTNTVLNGDNVTTDRTSRSVKLCANPTTHEDETGKVIIDSYQIIFEFFITYQQYNSISEYYTNDSISENGYKDYLYETYNRNSPMNSPVYILKSVFETNYTSINLYQFEDEIIVGVSSQHIVDLIDELGDLSNITVDDEVQLKYIQESYNNLPASLKQEVTNYSTFEKAFNVVLPAKKVESGILNLPNPEDLSYLDDYDVSKSASDYKNLTSEQKEYVSDEAVSKLERCQFYSPIVKVYYYINKIRASYNIENENDKLKEFNNSVKNSVKFYNALTADQKAAFDADEFNYLSQNVDIYNQSVEENNRLTLQ